jgi:hypothetical protein
MHHLTSLACLHFFDLLLLRNTILVTIVSPVTFFERWECLKLQLLLLPLDQVFPSVETIQIAFSVSSYDAMKQMESGHFSCLKFYMITYSAAFWLLNVWATWPINPMLMDQTTKNRYLFCTGTRYTNVGCFCIKMWCAEWLNYYFLGTF